MPRTATADKFETMDAKSSPEARGKRLKFLRMSTGLSRREVQDKYRISASTIQSWEDAKAGGLTMKGAKRVIAVFKEEGLRCSIDWLLYGIGTPPQLSNKLFDDEEGGETTTTPIEIPGEDQAIVNELLEFRKNNPDAIEYKILAGDDGMAPMYKENDYVAGKRRLGDAINNVVGFDCIIETRDNEILFRRLKPGRKPNTYTLISVNTNATIAEPVLYDRELISAAPVIWHRRKDPVKA